MRSKQEEPETLAQSQNYDIIGISKIWWEEFCDWGVNKGRLQALHKGRAGQARRGGVVVLYIMERLGCMELAVGNDMVESL